MLAFPLGGVGSGSLALGGRGQLRDWEIFNRPNKGFSPPYAFPAIWIKAGDAKPIARVLEARILPPYEGQDGLGSNNSPGLSRIAGAEFTAQYPLAHLRFQDPSLPVKIELDAFSPFIPHDPDASGLPVAILRYRVTNPGRSSAAVAISFSIDNPVKAPSRTDQARDPKDPRVNKHRTTDRLEGLLMTNPGVAAGDPMQGSFALAATFRSRCKDHLLARLASRALVEFADVVLGCLLTRWGTPERARIPERGRGTLPAEIDPGRRVSGFHLPPGLAFPQPYPRLVRMGRSQG